MMTGLHCTFAKKEGIVLWLKCSYTMEQMLTYTYRYSARNKNRTFWVVQKSIRCTLLEIDYTLGIELLFNGGVVNTHMKLCAYEIVWKQQVWYMLYVHKFVMLMIHWLGHWDAVWLPAIMPCLFVCLFVLWLHSELGTFH